LAGSEQAISSVYTVKYERTISKQLAENIQKLLVWRGPGPEYVIFSLCEEQLSLGSLMYIIIYFS